MKHAHQRKTFTNEASISTLVEASDRLIEAPELMVVRLHGFDLSWTVLETGGSDNLNQVIMALQAIDRVWDFGTIGIAMNISGGIASHQSTIHVVDWIIDVNNLTGVGFQRTLESISTGWVPCELLVPSLHLYLMAQGTQARTQKFLVNVEYSYEKVTPAELAAVNLSWGRDPVDAVR